jgi:hypothetical protein
MDLGLFHLSLGFILRAVTCHQRWFVNNLVLLLAGLWFSPMHISATNDSQTYAPGAKIKHLFYNTGRLQLHALASKQLTKPCHGSGGYSPDSHRADPSSVTGQSVRDFFLDKVALGQGFLPVNFIPSVLHYSKKRKNKSSS